MNRYFLILISAVLMFLMLSGCTQNSNQGTPPPLNKVKWGMNVAEVMSALELSDSDVKETSSGFTLINGEFFNKSAEVALVFSEQFHTLVGINAALKLEDVENVEKSINKERGKGRYTYNNKMEPTLVRWDDELLEKNKKSLSTIEDIYSKNDVKTTDDSFENGVSIGSTPLSHWEIILDKDDSLYGMVRLTGQIAAMLNYPEKYNTK